MSLTALTFDHWCTLDGATARSRAEEAARQVGGTLAEWESDPALGRVPHRAVIERDGQGFALIPGGEVRVGFDLAAWSPTAEQLRSYREESIAGGFGFDADLFVHLAGVLTPRRTVTVPTLLMAVEAEALSDVPAEVASVLAARGLRPPTPDEWEHAAGAGAETLFRWGDTYPADSSPYGEGAGPHHLPNAFGLRFGYGVYEAEVTSDPGHVYGGDGGEAACGGYGTFLTWLPMATANHNPGLAEFLREPDDEDSDDDFFVRPVVELR
ncbi:hypothetical protein [Streptomyces sp. NBC_00102]|uniref:hypothetical protein n=1 Tax=Streptomyces sp. NBC_00102 TaxID=2975652 RepID=UPI00224E014C|nr:hypothetical protein [Streptomyces sp. NBC_00102]MCX5396599.1 hypothetical protein [Streptomyces sp. NBC_00102]